jgi:hypothetical protein
MNCEYMIEELAKAHIKNLHSIRKATTQVNRALNVAINNCDELQERIYIRLLIILWMTWAECKLNALLTEHPQVTDEDREYIDVNSHSELDRWNLILERFIRRRYLNDDPDRELSRLTLRHTTFHRYMTLSELINNNIALYIEIRNRLAHGQWHIALNSELNAKNPTLTQSIWKLSKVDVLILKRTLMVVSNAIRDLISSKKTFEDNFDKHLRDLDLAKKQFEGRMDDLRASLLSKRYRPWMD